MKLLELGKAFIRKLAYLTLSLLFRLSKAKNCYQCPICKYYGRFKNIIIESTEIIDTRCPKCSSTERQRLQYLVIKEIGKKSDLKKMSMLHFAPENSLRSVLKKIFEIYLTADLTRPDVDRKEDLTQLSFNNDSFDFIFASHVLEHIKNDTAALSEIKRVLKPEGMAIIPVPIMKGETVEYALPDPQQYFHVRYIGEDYYERYKAIFSKILFYKSTDFSEKYHLHTSLKTGEKFVDIVPVCFK